MPCHGCRSASAGPYRSPVKNGNVGTFESSDFLLNIPLSASSHLAGGAKNGAAIEATTKGLN